jgi:nuclear pore complex protein Nup85
LIFSQDANFTTFLADQLLQRYCAVGSFSAEDLLDHLGSCMVVSDRLTFLAKYREFHRLCQATDFKAAATLLHSLLWYFFFLI